MASSAGLFTAEHHLYRSVIQIADPTINTQFVRLPDRCLTEADSLHPAST